MVVCTKLVRWMAGAAVFMELWYAAMTGWLPVTISPQLYQALMPVGCSAMSNSTISHVFLNCVTDALVRHHVIWSKWYYRKLNINQIQSAWCSLYQFQIGMRAFSS